MKETGVIRRIDELGRIVVPKEIRDRLRIKSGDQLDISIINNNILLNKYNPLDEELMKIDMLLKCISEVYGVSLILCGYDDILVSSDKNILKNDRIEQSFANNIKEHSIYSFTKEMYIKITNNYINDKNGYALKIMKDYHYIGFILILSEHMISKADIKVLELVKKYIINLE